MPRLTELLAKQADKSITEEEEKELQALIAKAEEAEGEDEGNDEEEIEKAAQAFADKVTSKIEDATKGFEKVVEALEKSVGDSKVERGYIIDKKLGKKTPEELAEVKVVVSERKAQGKKHTEVSMKTVHFLHALLNKNVEKLQLLSEGTADYGGYLVPEEFANMIVEDIRDQAVMRNLASQMTIQSDTLHLPNLASRPQAAWRAEKAVKQTSTVQFGEQVFTPYSLASIVGLSNELAADASLGVNGSIVNYIAGVMSQALTEKEEQAFWMGDGSGKPTGVNNYSLRTVAAGSTDATRADSIISAFFRTPQGYRNRGAFVANASTLERIAQLKDTQGRYLLSTLGESATFTFKGRPVYEQNDLPGGTAFYGDFSYYQIVDREGISVRVSDEATVAGSSAFEKNLTFVRVEKRVDGELTLPAAVTKITGLGSF